MTLSLSKPVLICVDSSIPIDDLHFMTHTYFVLDGAGNVNIMVNGDLQAGPVFTGVPAMALYPCVCFYGSDRSARLVSTNKTTASLSTVVPPAVSSVTSGRFDSTKTVNVRVEASDSSGKTVSSTSSSKGHAIVNTPLTGKCSWELKITKDVYVVCFCDNIFIYIEALLFLFIATLTR